MAVAHAGNRYRAQRYFAGQGCALLLTDQAPAGHYSEGTEANRLPEGYTMLEALAAKKDGGAFSRACEREDYVTSAIFGPLRFLPTAAVWEFVENILLPPGLRGNIEPRTHTIDFWPRMPRRSSTIEPDVVLSFSEKDAAPRLVVSIETKWNWKVSADQLNAQIEGQQEGLRAAHGKDAEIVSVLVSKQFPDGLLSAQCLTWASLCAFHPSPLLAPWYNLVFRALARLGEHPAVPFKGFCLTEQVESELLKSFKVAEDQWMQTMFSLAKLPAESMFVAAQSFPQYSLLQGKS